jgi:exodeoxyribonuclease VII large subunit
MHNRQRDIYTVSRLNSEVRSILEGSFPLLWVQGEISNLARPASGHIYFSLKDPSAQARCAMFKMKRLRLRFQPENGMQVLLRARISLYEARGEFQLIVEHMEPAGEGELQRAFEELKQRLDSEGLFAPEHKQQLPQFPRRIGVITSPSGAAIRDVLSVLRRRFPSIPVVIYPTLVQGDGAAAEITEMLQLADRREECDLLILTRGGGSLEDLMPFNDEGVARAIHAMKTPLISAVGHEIDFTIADFVADQRAATPSAAAELATPDRQELGTRCLDLQQRLEGLIWQRWERCSEQLSSLQQRHARLHAGLRLQQQQQRQDELEQRLIRGVNLQLQQQHTRLKSIYHRLYAVEPRRSMAPLKEQIYTLGQRLLRSINSHSERRRQLLLAASRNLNALSPLATLERGYSITSKPSTGKIIRDPVDISVGDRIETRLAKGTLLSLVESKEE